MTKAIKVLFATSEIRPLVSAGGLGEAASGLVAALRAAGADVTVALPDYQSWPLTSPSELALDVPDWAAPSLARVGEHPSVGKVAFFSVPGIERPDPYVDEHGQGWPDNTNRFAAFAAAVAAYATTAGFDVVHLNDWHTALAPAFLAPDQPTVLTIHNLGHQGGADHTWADRLPAHRDAYLWGDGINSLAGAIRAAWMVTTVSPTYVAEILTEADGMGLHTRLAERTSDLVGIRNGIDVRTWDPATDEYTPNFSSDQLDGKLAARQELLNHIGWDDSGEPIVAMITRLVEQKGVDLAFQAAQYLEGMRARMVVLGSGDRRLADWARWLHGELPDRFWFYDGYDVPLSHRLFGGSDVLLMPSQFEPCGLAQMQAMAYGTIPVVTAVGGLADTVVDADAFSDGNGFVALSNDESGIVDALHRSLRAVRHAGRRKAIQGRGMDHDWSWAEPAQRYFDVYREVLARK